MAPHPISLPCALALPPASLRDATTSSPCSVPLFVTQECIIFSNPTLSKPRLCSDATMSDDTLSALTPPWHCTSILQPATPPKVVAFESQTISATICLNRFTLAGSRKSDLWTCVCVFTFSSSDFAFLIKTNFSFKFLFANWSLSPQRFHYYFYLYSFLAVSKIFNHSDTCAALSVCNAVGLLILLKLGPVFTFLQQLMTTNSELFTQESSHTIHPRVQTIIWQK